MTFDLTTVLAAAERSSAAYLIDPEASRAAFENLGLTWHGLYQNDDHQAVVTSDAAGRCYLSIAGTRFADGKLGDVLDDLDASWVNVGQGAEVLNGAYRGCRGLFSWAQAQVASGARWSVEGHSLGGWRARYSPLFLPTAQLDQLVTFESPRSANAAYYARFADVFDAATLAVVNGHDLFVGWPWLSTEACHPPQAWWHLLGDGTLSIEDPSTWPGGLSIELVVSRLRALAYGTSAVGTPPLAAPPASPVRGS